tara:strand:- start:430 stop:612 length:183 start_codon:yes stop_codon:yes gene_type:complete
MSMKDCKREYRVDWIEYGNLYSRWYYKEADAKNLAFKLKQDTEIKADNVSVSYHEARKLH